MWKTLSPRSNPSLKNERSTLCCSSRLLKKAQMWRCSPRIPPAHCTEPTVVATFHLLLLGRDPLGQPRKDGKGSRAWIRVEIVPVRATARWPRLGCRRHLQLHATDHSPTFCCDGPGLAH